MPPSSGLIHDGGNRYHVPKGTTQAELQRMFQELDRRRDGKPRRKTNRRAPQFKRKQAGGIVEYEDEDVAESPGRVRRYRKGGEG